MPGTIPATRGWRQISKSQMVVGFFLASEFVFFAFLIIAYIDFHSAAAAAGPRPSGSLHPATMGIWTVFLFASSPTISRAGKALREESRRRVRLWLGVTILFGALFLFGEGHEYFGLLSRHIDLQTNLFGTTFFTLTGFHAFHVFVGLCMMSILLLLSYTSGLGSRDPRRTGAFESVAMYWHFVDAMWVLIFSVVYLWSTAR
jgi:heme/copper-type cytochrome/quinol oxidase subunit 3